MEVKSVFMDLTEGKKKGNVWKLESEAFKKPIEIKIGYDNKELAEFKKRIDDLEKNEILNKDKFTALQKYDLGLEEGLDLHLRSLLEKEKKIRELEGKIKEDESEIKSLYKVIADLKTIVETQSGTILHLQEKTGQILKNLTKQPIVIHDKGFMSGHESVALGTINIPDGDYLLVAKYVIGEHNEYVENENDIIFDKVHVEGQCYFPFYKLEGGTPLDVPTATVYYDLIFMPI